MFETQVADLLQRAAGEYIRGIDKTALKISVLSGDVILRRLQLKPEAFERLNLPIDLTRGVVGSLRVKIPWAKLGKEPVVVTIRGSTFAAWPRAQLLPAGAPCRFLTAQRSVLRLRGQLKRFFLIMIDTDI